ncbi:DUF1801 domain-containing protein [Candidatus Neomarinimicrobiota bacterium]
MQSKAKTVAEYLAELADDRRAAIEEVRQIILSNLPEGIEENMNWGMIAYEVPLSVYPSTYNGQPLMYAALASQKNHMAVYLTGIYIDKSAQKKFEDAYRSTGKKYDMGKSCVRFRRLEDLPLKLIGDVIGSTDIASFIADYEASRSKSKIR